MLIKKGVEITDDLIEVQLRILESRFRVKIDRAEYYLAYSGGRDSHFLLWFIRDYMGWNDIPIVAVNTRMEHPEIRARIEANATVILLPKLKPFEIKAQYGIPCFTKFQDEMIERYQRGSRSYNTMCAVTGENRVKFKLNNTARELLLSGKLHKVSNKCCKFTKKQPLHDYEKRTGLKGITGMRGAEGILRQEKVQTCLDKKGKFSPLFDVSDDMIRAIEKKYNIDVPKIYEHISRTGCFGCPYGKDCEKELALLGENQRKFAIKYFGESYAVKGIKTEVQQ